MFAAFLITLNLLALTIGYLLAQRSTISTLKKELEIAQRPNPLFDELFHTIDKTQDALMDEVATRIQAETDRDNALTNLEMALNQDDENEKTGDETPSPRLVKAMEELYVSELEHVCPECKTPAGELCDTPGVWVHLERIMLAESSRRFT